MALDDKILQRRFYPAGAVIFAQGQPGETAFVIQAGKVAIYQQVGERRVHLSTLHAGGLFGEMAVIDGSPRMASAVALVPTTLIMISRHHIETKLGKSDKFIRSLIQMLLDNLRNVHKSYTHRPRSVQDILKVMNDHVLNLKDFIQIEGREEVRDAALERLSEIEASMAALELLLANHPDRRESTIPDLTILP